MTKPPPSDGPCCIVCGIPTPPLYLTAGHCETCRLATWLPDDYQKQERYQYDPAEGHANATRRPSAGVALLNGHPPRIFEVEPPIYAPGEEIPLGTLEKRVLARWLGVL